jgi:hypothetical protein
VQEKLNLCHLQKNNLHKIKDILYCFLNLNIVK